MDPDRLEAAILADWEHLTRDVDVTASNEYLRQGGKPVLALCGTWLCIIALDFNASCLRSRHWICAFASVSFHTEVPH